MAQILHLMNRNPDLQSERTSRAIARAAGSAIEITTRTIGRGGTYRNAGQAAMALRFGRGVLFDVVHAWDVPSVLAACASPSPVVFSPTLPSAGAPAWLKPAMVYRNGTVIATTATMRESLIRQGIPAYRCDVISPAVDFAQSRNDALRQAMGFSADDKVLLAPGESIRIAGHLLALHAISILHVLSDRYRLLIWGRGDDVGAVNRLAGRLRQPRVLVIAERKLGRSVPFEDLLGAADLALVTARPEAPSLPLVMCMAAGLPTVAVATGLTRELFDAGHTALVVPRPAPRLLAKAVMELVEDEGQMAGLRNSARLEAARRFGLRQTVQPYLDLYRRAAGITPKGASAPLEWVTKNEGERVIAR